MADERVREGWRESSPEWGSICSFVHCYLGWRVIELSGVLVGLKLLQL